MTPTMTASGFSAVDVPRLLERRKQCAEKHGNNCFGLTLEQFLAVDMYRNSTPTLRSTEVDSGEYQRDRGQKGKERLTLKGLMKAITPSLNAASGDKGPRKCATKAENGGHQVNLIDVTAHLSGQGGGVLNPRWCEWYMGFPDGWCDLPSKHSATP